jgi:hypothetical protein
MALQALALPLHTFEAHFIQDCLGLRRAMALFEGGEMVGVLPCLVFQCVALGTRIVGVSIRSDDLSRHRHLICLASQNASERGLKQRLT